MSLQRHLQGRGLQIDNTRPSRFFFPPKDGKAHTIRWRPMRNSKRSPGRNENYLPADGDVA
jgi:hypothetical protein